MSVRSPQSPRRQDPARPPSSVSLPTSLSITAPLSAMALALLMAAGAAQAQTTAQGTVGADPKAPMSDVDRAKRDADKVFQWIKFHAEKGEARKAAEKQHEAKAEPPKPAAKAAPTPAPAAPAVATKRQDLDPAAERALAERAQTERMAERTAAPTQGLTPATTPAIAQNNSQNNTQNTAQTATAAPVGVAAPTAAQLPPPQVVAMAAPTTSAPAGRPPVPAPTAPAAEPEEDMPLKLVHKVDPEYPRSWLVQQRNGSVLVNFRVKTDGTVENAEALRSPDRKVAAAALAAVKQWRFEPIARPKQVSVEIGFQVE